MHPAKGQRTSNELIGLCQCVYNGAAGVTQRCGTFCLHSLTCNQIPVWNQSQARKAEIKPSSTHLIQRDGLLHVMTVSSPAGTASLCCIKSYHDSHTSWTLAVDVTVSVDGSMLGHRLLHQAMQMSMAEKRGHVGQQKLKVAGSLVVPGHPADQTANIASAAVRGAAVGAAGHLTVQAACIHPSGSNVVCLGGGMALMLGPTAPTDACQRFIDWNALAACRLLMDL